MMELFEQHLSSLLIISHQTDDSLDLTLEIPDSFPFLDGHFPNQPILPASIALELTAWLAIKYFLKGKDATIRDVERSKFNRNIAPMDRHQIKLTACGNGSFRGRWLATGGDIAVDLRFTLS